MGEIRRGGCSQEEVTEGVVICLGNRLRTARQLAEKLVSRVGFVDRRRCQGCANLSEVSLIVMDGP